MPEAFLRRNVQRCVTTAVLCVDSRFGSDQCSENFNMPVLRGQVQRRGASTCCLVDCSTGVEQQLDNLRVAALSCQMQWRVPRISACCHNALRLSTAYESCDDLSVASFCCQMNGSPAILS